MGNVKSNFTRDTAVESLDLLKAFYDKKPFTATVWWFAR